MAVLVWDENAERLYETGLDKGVLYLPDGSAVPWNGLVSIVEKFNREVSPIYFDGVKIADLVSLGEFKATLRAITYPDEFLELEGLDNFKNGMFLGDQYPKLFNLCYRTRIGNALEASLGYKIHIVYNLTAIPLDTTYSSISDDFSLIEFEWDISAVPEEVPGYAPTAHIIVDSTKTDPWLLEDLEEKLYGSASTDPTLDPMLELFTYLRNWSRIQIIDNLDGTWTAISARDELITLDSEEQLFTITDANATYLNESTYSISDSEEI